MKSDPRILGLVFIACAYGCSVRSPPHPESETGALRIAQDEFTNRHLGQATNFTIRISDDHKFGRWNVWFIQKGDWGDPGGDVLIRVDKKNGHATTEPSY